MTRTPIPQLPTDRSAAAFERENVFGEPTDLEKRARTAIALQSMKLMDSEVAYQAHVPTKRRHLAVRALKATGKIAGLGCWYAAKGTWAATKYIFSRMSSRRSIRITIIEW